jgi:hypothetical protein
LAAAGPTTVTLVVKLTLGAKDERLGRRGWGLRPGLDGGGGGTDECLLGLGLWNRDCGIEVQAKG